MHSLNAIVANSQREAEKRSADKKDSAGVKIDDLSSIPLRAHFRRCANAVQQADLNLQTLLEVTKKWEDAGDETLTRYHEVTQALECKTALANDLQALCNSRAMEIEDLKEALAIAKEDRDVARQGEQDAVDRRRQDMRKLRGDAVFWMLMAIVGAIFAVACAAGWIVS